MSIEQPYNYRIPNHIKDIKNEKEKVIALLRNIRANASLLRIEFARESFQNISEAVEKGEWSFQNLNALNRGYLDRTIEKNVVLNHNINLSEAKQIVDDYRRHSEKGCEYCGNLGKVEGENKTGKYCKIGETEKDINWKPISNNDSLKIRESSKKYCDDRKPALMLLEEILKEIEDN